MLTLPFSLLPGSSKLFNDYCNGIPIAARFFPHAFQIPDSYESLLNSRGEHPSSRKELVAVLEEQQAQFGAGKASRDAITLLKDSNTFAVCTGQQVGIFGGPLYSIYKALTALHLASWLKEQFPSFSFVPVFWLESEDHDLDEVRSVGLVNGDNDFHRVQYGVDEDPEEKNIRPVGSIEFDERIDEAVHALMSQLPPSDFTADVTERLSRSYHPGNTFSAAFAQFFFALFPNSGLVFVDPSDARLKQMVAPVILRELETFPAAGEAVIQRSALLEKVYHAQVKPRAVNLFHLSKGGRYGIEPSEYGFFLKGTRQRFTREELIAIANEHPELFSPNVLMRPIIQDSLFPTIAYVAGPAEVAYFAQLQPVYDHFGVHMPVIFPRASITIIEKKIQKLFNKFDLQYSTLFDSPEEIYRSNFLRVDSNSSLQEYESMKASLGTLLDRLPGIASSISPNLSEPARATVMNMKKLVQTFENKLLQTHQEKDSVLQRQLDKMQVYLAPEGKPQERQLNIVTYLNRYGEEILNRIDQCCVPFPAEHRLLNL